MKATLRKYGGIFWMGVKDSLFSPATLLARALFFIVIVYVFSQLWQALQKGGVGLGASASAADLVWYLFITESIVLSLPPIPEQVDKDIQTGDIAYQLVRPLDYIGNRSMLFLSETLSRFAVNAVVGSVAVLLLVGAPTHTANLAVALPLIFGAFLIHLGISLSIAMLGFWVEDTLPFFWIYSKASFILGGLFMPIDFYPHWLQELCRLFPLRDGVYSVAQVALSFQGSTVATLMMRQLLWAAGGLAVAALLYRSGVERLEARGG